MLLTQATITIPFVDVIDETTVAKPVAMPLVDATHCVTWTVTVDATWTTDTREVLLTLGNGSPSPSQTWNIQVDTPVRATTTST